MKLAIQILGMITMMLSITNCKINFEGSGEGVIDVKEIETESFQAKYSSIKYVKSPGNVPDHVAIKEHVELELILLSDMRVQATMYHGLCGGAVRVFINVKEYDLLSKLISRSEIYIDQMERPADLAAEKLVLTDFLRNSKSVYLGPGESTTGQIILKNEKPIRDQLNVIISDVVFKACVSSPNTPNTPI